MPPLNGLEDRSSRRISTQRTGSCSGKRRATAEQRRWLENEELARTEHEPRTWHMLLVTRTRQAARLSDVKQRHLWFVRKVVELLEGCELSPQCGASFTLVQRHQRLLQSTLKTLLDLDLLL
jgi:hypothetical protein